MILQHYVVFLIVSLSIQYADAIPDNSVVWAAHEGLLYYSSKAEDWTRALISPNEIGQSIDPANIDGTRSVYGIAGDVHKRLLVTTDRDMQFLAIYNVVNSTATVFHLGTSKDIGQVAIDWLGRNVYWADTGYGWIAMKRFPANINQHNSIDPNFRLVVDKYLKKPTGLVVHPEKYYLFWTDTSSPPKIERSDLIGGNRAIIIWHSLIMPTSLCIDQSADRLYWSDPARGTIEYSDFDGNGRRVLSSDTDVDFYGIAIFQDSLIYTAPTENITGFVSLKENNEGKHIQNSIRLTTVKLYHVMVYAEELQPIHQDALCKSVDECDQICLHMEQDAGFTCLCDDGYELSAGKHCLVDDKVLERHILFTRGNSICTIPISVLGLIDAAQILDTHCDVVSTDYVVTRFAVDMVTKVMFYTNGSVIFRQTAFKQDREVLYETDDVILDMDYDWKTGLLYWIEADDGYLHYIDAGADEITEPDTKKLSDLDVTNLAVDPHNRQIFWIVKDNQTSNTKYLLNAWRIPEDDIVLVQTTLLIKPTDLEYDRVNDRLLWNDDDGHIGMINTDGTGERKYDSPTTGEKRHAITVYKNFIITTTAENRQFDVIYELEPRSPIGLSIHPASDWPVQDVHVVETTLQPSNLEPCEVDNGGCEHICLPGNELKCACFLGYVLDSDKRSCRTVTLSDNFFVILDAVHGGIYQVDQVTKTPYAIEIDKANVPTALAFDPVRKDVIWVDTAKHAVIKKTLGSSEEIAVRSGVDDTAAISVDVSTGNVYISTGGEIIVVGPYLDTLTVVDSTNIDGTIGKIALMPESGLIAWYEHGGGSLRIMIGNMDGTNVRPITVDMNTPEDIAFDLEDETSLFWCDSGLDKIEKINTQSLATTTVYKDRGLKPVAIEISGDVIYFVPKHERKIVQINKSDGLQQVDVFESPLFGSFKNFFLSRTGMKGHELCEKCNSGCSNLCLPNGKSKKCACAEGTRLKDDETTCQHADVCPKDSYSSVTGLKPFVECCPGLPDAVCKPECEQGYTQTPVASVQCKNGKWSTELGTICKVSNLAKENNELPIIYIAVGVGGGVALLVTVIVVYMCACRRSPRKYEHRGEINGHAQVVQKEDYVDGYAVANGILSPDPPPRPTPEPEPEVYDYLDENDMIDASKLHVVMPTSGEDVKKPVHRENSTNSVRYSKFPPEYGGYLTPMYVKQSQGEPQPDYNDYTKNEHVEMEDGYLRANSLASGSQRSTLNGSFDQTHSFHVDNSHPGDQFTVNFTSGEERNTSGGQVSINRSGLPSGKGSQRAVRYSRNPGPDRHSSRSEHHVNSGRF